jgi:hypothetical protein
METSFQVWCQSQVSEVFSQDLHAYLIMITYVEKVRYIGRTNNKVLFYPSDSFTKIIISSLFCHCTFIQLFFGLQFQCKFRFGGKRIPYPNLS